MAILIILKYLKPKEWTQTLVIFVLSVVQVWLDLKFPDYMALITKLLQTPGSRVNEIWSAGASMLLCAIGSLLCVIAVSYLASQASSALAARVRGMVFAKVESFSMEEVGRFSTASLITRCTNDITQMQTFFVAGLQMLLKVPILAIGGILKIAGKGNAWTFATLIAFLIMLAAVAAAMTVALPIYRTMQTLVDRLNLVVRESLAGRFVIRAFNAEGFHSGKFEQANDAFTSADQRTNRAMASMSPFMSIANNGIIIAIYGIGVAMINAAGPAEALTIFSDMAIFSFYVAQVFNAIKFITKVLPRWPRATASARRVNDVLHTEPAIQDGLRMAGEAGAEGEVVFQDVCFRYPGAASDALEDISFTAKQGETVAFIGSTGSGKSTLVNLIPRLYEATGGQILVDGVNVKEYNLKALNNRIGYVPQRAVLFRGTVNSNVAYGDNGGSGYSPEDIRRAVRIAQGQDFVENLEGGYDAAVSQGGTTVSGGQKQRLSIARAICRQPEILIFDDAFSALDYQTERTLREALKQEIAGATIFVVAQRIGSIMDADRIIVLEDGKIAGQGTHRELLRDCRVYREIALSQLSEEELAS